MSSSAARIFHDLLSNRVGSQGRLLAFRASAALTIFAALAGPLPLGAAPETTLRPRVFVLQSYHPGLSWTEGISEGIREVFARSNLDADIATDYLEARRYPEPELLSQAAALIERRMLLFKPDLVLSCDNAALSFVLTRRPRVFPNAPIVFCGVNSFSPSMLAGQRNITGIPEEVSIADTVTLAFRLFPGARRLVVIGRTAVAADAANRDAFLAALPGLPPAAQAAEFWDDLSLAQLRTRLKSLDRNTIVFINGLAADEMGHELMYDQTTSFIRENCNAPLFSLWDVYFGFGIVGGKLISGRKQGQLAASLAVRLLKGERAEDLPVAGAQEANQYFFDQKELRRFGISRRRLPANSIVLGDPLAQLRQYWRLAAAVGLFIVVESAILVVLVLAFRLLRKTQRILRNKEQRLDLALAGADLGVWDWNLKSGQAAYDERWAQMLGFRSEEIEPRAESWERLLHPEDKPRRDKAWAEHLAGRAPMFEAEYRLCHKSGAWIWVLAKGRVVERDESGRPVRACGTHLDITERKLAEERRLELERQLLQSQKLESLGLLAGGIAHDFNNLLTAILGNLDLALSDLPSSSPIRAGVEEAVSAAQNAAGLTRQMLAYSGKGRFVIRQIELNAFIQELVGLLRMSIPKTATLSLRLEPSSPVVLADSAQIEQVIINLITNAAEALGEAPGLITIATGSRSYDADELRASLLEEKPAAGRFAWIEVSDTGSGMSPETLRRLFDPYFSTKQTGRGLGMAAVQGIVRGHRGAIMIQSEPGSGTTVRVLFPLAAAGGAAPAAEPGKGAGAKSSSPLSGLALVIDDEAPVRSLARRALEMLGLRVEAVADSEAGLAYFRDHAQEITIVLLDLTMPKIDGAAVLREMKRIRADARILLSSGYNEQEVTRRFSKSDLAGFIQKPYRIAAFQAEIRRILGAG